VIRVPVNSSGKFGLSFNPNGVKSAVRFLLWILTKKPSCNFDSSGFSGKSSVTGRADGISVSCVSPIAYVVSAGSGDVDEDAAVAILKSVKPVHVDPSGYPGGIAV
jgi:hypothetical protein